MLLHYRLVEKIGEGGMGVVWKAVDTTLDREVAIKILPEALAADAERLQRFEREAKVLASLNHPNVATVHGFHDVNGVRFLVMELVSGETLEERLKRGRLTPDEALPIARSIAEGIEYAHERGIVHRDLKPANVKLTADGGVKVLDFGLAKAIAGDPTMTGPTSTPTVMPTLTSMGTVAGLILGTAAYMSPEQARGASVDRRADIWAFGAVLFEMLAGRRAFEGDTVSDTLASVLRAPLEWDALPASTPASVLRLLKRCLERDAKKRLRDIGEARIALDPAAVEPEPAAAEAPPAAAPKRTLVPWALFAVAAVAAVLLGGMSLMQKPATAPPVARFFVDAGDKLARMDAPRISPDGRLIAFQGFDEAGKQSIWIRPIDSLTAYPLAGTEGALQRPFWSPDSKFLAYFDGRQLKKIPVAGGPPQLIGESEFGADGTWGAGGVILFDGAGASASIKRIPAAGGTPSQAFEGDPAKQPPAGAWPFFLPDGKHFLFTASIVRAGAPRTTICFAELGRPGFTELTETGSRVEYASGYLVYVLHGTLVAHRFDPDKGALAGDPVPLAGQVSENGTRALFSTSPSGALVYQSGAAVANSEIVRLDRTGKETAKIGAPGIYADLTLSPDGTRLAYTLKDVRADALDVWIRDLARDTASRLTFETTDEARPVWSPDGTRVIYGSRRLGLSACMAKPANGTGDETEIFKDNSAGVSPRDVSPDGRWIAIDRFVAIEPPAAFVIPADGKGEPLRIPGGGMQLSAKFSPDGRFIAYTSNESGGQEVYVQTWPFGGGKWQISNGSGFQPLWRADGKELFYRDKAFQFFAVPVTLEPRFSAGTPQPLFNRRLGGGINAPTWAVTANGQGFVLNASLSAAQSVPLTVVLNWPETLAK